MATYYFLLLCYLYICSYGFFAIAKEEAQILSNLSDPTSALQLHGFKAQAQAQDLIKKPTLLLNIKHQSFSKATDSVLDSIAKQDLNRIQTLYSGEPVSAPAPSPESYAAPFSGQITATLRWAPIGYLMDVFIGTPPKRFPLLLDTGSDLNWIQCHPCHDCFQQAEPIYNPKESTSYRTISCRDPKCNLIPSPICNKEDQNLICPYYYSYGDNSNSTGDFASETFTVNLTTESGGESRFTRVENVMFGCGHWNRGMYNGAAGMLGLGRGPLSFSSQLKSLYGDSFSYCMVDTDSKETSKVIFGEDEELLNRADMNFTKLIHMSKRSMNTHYYVEIKSVFVGGEELNIPEETWNESPFGSGGGTIVDSGTILSHFVEPAYRIIKDAFVRKVKGYRVVKDFPILGPCYKVSGVGKLEMPSLRIVFRDGAIWDFPVENCFVRLRKDIVCLAILSSPGFSVSIIGNHQQQNFQVLYDTKRSRLGFVPRKCAEM